MCHQFLWWVHKFFLIPSLQIHITSCNSTETLAHYRKVCSCHVYQEEYAVNFIIFVLVLYKKQCIYINIVPLYCLALAVSIAMPYPLTYLAACHWIWVPEFECRDRCAEHICSRKCCVHSDSNLQICDEALNNSFHSRVQEILQETSAYCIHVRQLTVGHKLCDTDHEERLIFVNCCLLGVCDG